MDGFRQDLRYALRGLASRPLFTAVIVASLAVGIGANAAVFGLADRLLLRKLPVADPDGLVILEWGAGPEFPARSLSGAVAFDEAGRSTSTSFSHPVFRAFAAGGELAAVAGFTVLDRVNAVAGGGAFLAPAEAVSGGYYRSLGVVPVVGRLLEPADDQVGAEPVVVLSEPLWRRRFGARATAVGAPITIAGVAATVVGVTPAAFRGLGEVEQAPELVVPLALVPRVQADPGLLDDPGSWWVNVVARVGVAERDGRAAALSERLRAAVVAARPDYPQPELLSVRLLPGSRGLSSSRASLARSLRLLAGVLAGVLLLACANVASLLLGRGLRRRHELAMRLALGAGRGRVVRLLLTECLVLSTAGTALGLLLAGWLRDLLPAALRLQATASLPPAELDGRTLAFSLALAVASGLGFGLLPALVSTQSTPIEELRGRGGSSGRSRLGGALVVVQVALSVALLSLAGLAVGTLRNLQREDLGFDPRGIVQVRLDAALAGYAPPAAAALRQTLRDRLAALPGVASVAISAYGPLGGGSSITSVEAIDGAPLAARTYLGLNLVDPGYFSTLGIAVRRGRALDAGDVAGGAAVVVIDEGAAKKLFGDADPLGRRLRLEKEEREIVGVTVAVKYAELRDGIDETLFVPLAQASRPPSAATFELRTAGDPDALLPAIRQAVAATAPDLALSELATQRGLLARATRAERTFAALSSAFAAVAAGLAGLGLFALLSLLVARRRRETGVRLALGATPGAVVRAVLARSFALGALGVALGWPLVPLAGRWVDDLLFGVDSRDPASAVLAATVMVAVALAAAAGPAARAGRVDPATVLRAE